MQAVILAGGLGTRISEESHLRPKPMIEIGGKPILWHVMKIYAAHGITDFVICAGYRGYMIKEYFANYVLHSSDVTIDARSGEITFHHSVAEPWKVTIVDTGAESMTGGRLKRVGGYLGERFCMTYGDGLADIDIAAEVAFHRSHGRQATVATVAPTGRFGVVTLDGGRVTDFSEKPSGDGTLINGGYFVLSPAVLDLVDSDATVWEREPLQTLAARGELMAHQHSGFWQPMDTLRERDLLQSLWDSGRAPWRVWP